MTLLVACRDKKTDGTATIGSAKKDTENIKLIQLRKIDSMISELDTLKKMKSGRLNTYIKELKDTAFTQYKSNIDLPDEFQNMITTWSYQDKIRIAVESPFSQSGDFNISHTHYFDKNGNTLAYTNQTNFFNCLGKDDVSKAFLKRRFDSEFQLIHQDSTFTNNVDSLIKKSDCIHDYDFAYEIAPTVKSFQKRIVIKEKPSIPGLEDFIEEWKRDLLINDNFVVPNACNNENALLHEGILLSFPNNLNTSYGDMNRDGKIDALVTFTPTQCDRGNATRNFQYALIVISRGGVYKTIETTPSLSLGLGDPFYKLHKANNGWIYGSYYYQVEEDSTSAYEQKAVTVRVKGDSLVYPKH